MPLTQVTSMGESPLPPSYFAAFAITAPVKVTASASAVAAMLMMSAIDSLLAASALKVPNWVNANPSPAAPVSLKKPRRFGLSGKDLDELAIFSTPRGDLPTYCRTAFITYYEWERRLDQWRITDFRYLTDDPKTGVKRAALRSSEEQVDGESW